MLGGKARKTQKNLLMKTATPARVDTLPRVRYAFEFTQLEYWLWRGRNKPPHAERKASHPRRGFFGVVQPTGRQGATRRLRAGARLHDCASLWMGALGERPAGARPALQGHRSSKRGVPPADPTQFHRQGKASRGRIFA